MYLRTYHVPDSSTERLLRGSRPDNVVRLLLRLYSSAHPPVILFSVRCESRTKSDNSFRFFLTFVAKQQRLRSPGNAEVAAAARVVNT